MYLNISKLFRSNNEVLLFNKAYTSINELSRGRFLGSTNHTICLLLYRKLQAKHIILGVICVADQHQQPYRLPEQYIADAHPVAAPNGNGF